MSRSRKHQGRPAVPASTPAAASAAVATPPEPHHAPPATRQRFALRVAAAAVLLWSLALALLAGFTSNPRFVSQDQILHADAVVVARRDGDSQDRLRIEEVLAGELAVDEVISVLNLRDASPPEAGPRWLVPLNRFHQDYLVTTLDGQRANPLIYSASAETQAEVGRILRDAHK